MHNLSKYDIFLINKCTNWPMMHYPDDLCYWTASQDEYTGEISFHKYQDDGFGNLIELSRENHRVWRQFVFGQNVH